MSKANLRFLLFGGMILIILTAFAMIRYHYQDLLDDYRGNQQQLLSLQERYHQLYIDYAKSTVQSKLLMDQHEKAMYISALSE